MAAIQKDREVAEGSGDNVEIRKGSRGNAEKERRKYEKEKGWEGWEGCDWSKVNWSNQYEYERFVRRDASWPYPGPDRRVKQYEGS